MNDNKARNFIEGGEITRGRKEHGTRDRSCCVQRSYMIGKSNSSQTNAFPVCTHLRVYGNKQKLPQRTLCEPMPWHATLCRHPPLPIPNHRTPCSRSRTLRTPKTPPTHPNLGIHQQGGDVDMRVDSQHSFGGPGPPLVFSWFWPLQSNPY